MPTDDKPFPCEYCSRTFARQHDLRRHVETHSGDKPYACAYPGCQHTYTRKDALKRHQDASNHHV
ncbi:hypothetical protein AURDEDRAFT_55751 [Auricularia subglabra TFB-10046 SS5]|nr:hypothetical protein AURDEDRAFT_55751 [Auricularia subglabra TFB-10046 SS5]